MTSEGEDFIPLAERWISLEKETEQLMSKENSISNLNIGSVDSLNTYLFHPLYKNIIQSENSLSLNISSHWTFTVYNLLKSYEIDIGLPLTLVNFSNVITEPVFRERMVLVGGNQNFQNNDFIRPSDLDPSKEIYIYLGADLDQWRNYWFGQELQYKLLTLDTAGLLSRVLKDTDYWALVPVSIANDFKESMKISISQLEGDIPYRTCYKAKHRSPRSNAIKPIEVFEEYLYDFIRENPDLEIID